MTGQPRTIRRREKRRAPRPPAGSPDRPPERDRPVEKGVCRAAAELEVGGRTNPRHIPIDNPIARGPGLEFVDAGLPLPQEAEGKTRACGPITEEDFRSLQGLDVEQIWHD